MTKYKQVSISGKSFDYDAIVHLMDDELREYLHSLLAPCTEQEFLDAYLIAHQVRFSEEFTVD